MFNLNNLLRVIKENKIPIKIHLPISRFKLDEFDIFALADALELNETVTSLDMSGQVLTATAVARIFNGIKTHPNIRAIDFSACKIEGPSPIFSALRNHKSLQTISFRKSSLSSAAIMILFKTIKDSAALRIVDISGCKLTANDAKEIVKGLDSARCCVTDFYFDYFDGFPEIRARLDYNRTVFVSPMEGIEEILDDYQITEEGMFSDALEVHGIFGCSAHKVALQLEESASLGKGR